MSDNADERKGWWLWCYHGTGSVSFALAGAYLLDYFRCFGMYGSICPANLWNLVGVASHTIPSFLSRGSFVLAVVLFHMIIRALVLRLLYHRAALSLQKIYRRTTASWVKLKGQIFQQPPLYAMHNGHDNSTRTSCLTLQSLNIELPVSPKFSFGSIDATWTAVILPAQPSIHSQVPRFQILEKEEEVAERCGPGHLHPTLLAWTSCWPADHSEGIGRREDSA